MTDGVAIALGSVCTALITGAVTIATVVINKRQRIQDGKIDSYHKEVDGKMGELLETTKALGEAKGAADNQAITDAKEQDKK